MRLSFGRYVPLNSVIHRMDPRFKIAMIVLLIIAIFFPTGYTGYIILTAVIFGIFALSRLSWRMLSRVLIPTTIIFIVILIINIFLMKVDYNTLGALTKLTNGDSIHQAIKGMTDPNAVIKWNGIGGAAGNGISFHDAWVKQVYNSTAYGTSYEGYIPGNNGLTAYWTTKGGSASSESVNALGHFFHWKAFWFSERAVYSSFLMSWRIFLMITLTTIITGTTQPMEITLGLEDLLSPFKLIGIPVHILATIISIALRMIPDLIDEAGRIMKAQASRGIDLKNGKFADKFRAIISLIIPLLVSSFQKAEDLAYAMDARDYDPHAKRTRFHQFKFDWRDLVMFLAFGGVAVFMMVYGGLGSSIISWHIQYLDSLTLY